MKPRYVEVLTWVDQHSDEILYWVAIDDADLLKRSERLEGHFVKTDPKIGLTEDDANQAIKLFKGSNC